MTAPPAPHKIRQGDPPLWSIGLAVVVILGAPLVLYSLAPTGPLREGDTVFSDGQQRVQLIHLHLAPPPPLQRDETCLLDPGNPLIVVHGPNDQPDGSILGQVQGRPTIEWPFCPSHAEVLLKPHQIFQKPAVFRGVQEVLAKLVSR